MSRRLLPFFALLAACGAPPAPLWSAPREVSLSKGSSVLLDDDATELSMRVVHPTYRRRDGAYGLIEPQQ